MGWAGGSQRSSDGLGEFDRKSSFTGSDHGAVGLEPHRVVEACRDLDDVRPATEIQLPYRNNLTLRMRNYAALAEEKFNLPVYPVLINILSFKAPNVIPTAYESEFMGIRAYQNYRVINLWEIDVDIVFEQNLTSLLPFVPILQGP